MSYTRTLSPNPALRLARRAVRAKRIKVALIKTVLMTLMMAMLLPVLPMMRRTQAAGGSGMPEPPRDGKGLASLLNADGSVNLQAGITGSFDASGYHMELGANQEPRFVPTATQTTCTDNWDDRFAVPGVTNTGSIFVNALAVDSNNNVYIAGNFTAIGNLMANHIARWDGSSWSPLGSPTQNGIDGTGSVSALAVMGTDLYVGGFFTAVSDSTQASMPARSMARWSTTTNTWSALGSAAQNGVNNPVRALAVLGTDLYVGGLFNQVSSSTQNNVFAGRIARWSTTTNTWSPLGSATQNGVNGSSNSVNALAVIGTDLYVGGQFINASSSTQFNISANNIARWSTTTNTWSPLGSATQNGVSSSFSASVNALAVLDTDLYVGGAFSTANDSTIQGLTVNNIARWGTGTNTWSPLGSAAQNGVSSNVFALAVMGSDLYVGGPFSSVSDSTQTIGARSIARWSTSSSTWSQLGNPAQNGVSGQVNAMVVAGTSLFVGGFFTAVSDSTQLNLSTTDIARWNLTSSSWALMGGLTEAGLNNSVQALAVMGTDLYVAAAFTFAGDVPVKGIAKWNGFSWSALGSPTQNGVNGQVNALAVVGTDLYVGGFFTSVNDSTQANLSTNNIARWSTTTNTWSRLGNASLNGASSGVAALAVIGTNLYVGGFFTSVSDSTPSNLQAQSIARWNTTTSTWSVLGGTGSQNGLTNAVRALAVLGTDLYVGGLFDIARNGPVNISANRVARWSTTTSTWSALGSPTQNGVSGANSQVLALAVLGTDLYVGGIFTNASDSSQAGLSTNNIARWSTMTSTWSALGGPTQNGVNSQVLALASIGPDLYVGGSFTSASDGTQASLTANRIAHWDPLSGIWDDLDGGVTGTGGPGVGALTPIGFGLYVGGQFTSAGCRLSARLARYVVPPPDIRVRGNGIPIANHDTTPSASDNTDFGVASGGSGSVSKTFTIENLGLSGLSLSGTPTVAISGANAADFVVTTQPANAVAAGGLTTFTIQFTPGASGLRTAIVTIASSDPNDNPFDFSVAGNAFAGSVWTGAVSSDWHTASNWNNSTVPPAGSAVVLPATGVSHEVVISITDVSVANLTLSAGRTLTLANNRTLTVGSGATLTVANGAQVSVSSGSTLTCSGGASLVNNGTLANNQGGTISTSFGSTLTNNSTLNNNFGAAINNNFGATLTNTVGATFNNDGTLNNNFGATVNNPGALVNMGTISNSGTLALASGSLTVDSSAFLFIRASGTVTRTTGYVVGRMTKTFNSAGSFRFDVGTASGYSPLEVTATAGTGDLTISATQSVQPALASVSDKILQRYWTLTAQGNLTVNLVFHYLAADVMGTEANYRIIRVNGSTVTSFPNACPAPCVDAVNHTATINGVSSFSDWTVGEPAGPTAVELAGFTATGYDGGVYLEWQTGYEVKNLGFNLYRDQGGRRTLINRQMLAGSALLAGADTVLRSGRAYSFWDSSAAGQSDASYWLEDVDLTGRSSWHGPYFISPLGGAPPRHSDAEMLSHLGHPAAGTTLPLERPASLLRATAGPGSLAPPLASQAAVKILVKHEGWTMATAADLFAAGLDPKTDPQRLQLYADGQQLPISVATDAQGRLTSIAFYGRGIDAAYTDTRVYWLIAGTQPGLRISQVKADGFATAARSFFTTVERKDRTIYFSALRNGDKENFFGAVIAGNAVSQSLDLAHLDLAASGQAELEVALQGVTMQPHRVWAYVNGTFAGEIDFDGQNQGNARLAIAQALLREGGNDVKLEAQSGSSDVCLVDTIRLSYWHRFTADDNALRFSVSGNQTVTIDGFTSGAIRVFDITNPDLVSEIVGKIDAQKTGYAVTVSSPVSGERQLLAIADEKAARPARLAANQPSSLRTPAHAADLIIITPRDFLSAFAPLQLARARQGVKAELVDIEDIYDEFSFGNKSPQAVKDFLSYTASNWKTKPHYALLAGDASYDPKNYLGYGDSDLVPTRLIDTALMEAASDDWLADFNDDGMVELAVGRLPVHTAEEAAMMVAKLIAYDQATPIENVTLVADANDGFNFEGASQQLRALIPGSLRVEQINRGQMDGATAKAQLLSAINRGEKLINYAGHGSVNQWRGNLLTNDDVRGLANKDHQPVFVMMTCLNGYFIDPALNSLGEALMNIEAGGAIAVWASSAMTGASEQAVMNQQMVRLWFGSGGKLTLGDVTRQAKQAITDPDIRRTWILLGDPTMRLK